MTLSTAPPTQKKLPQSFTEKNILQSTLNALPKN